MSQMKNLPILTPVEAVDAHSAQGTCGQGTRLQGVSTPTEFDPQIIRTRLAGLGNGQFWRSLEEAAEEPEFERYLHREFPSQLAVWEDPIARRSFLKLMAASLAFAGVTGCTREPAEKIVPYTKGTENLVPGKPKYYATAISRGGYGLGVLVESHMGRPTKVEGNPDHPVTRGATDAFLQAAILALYDPDRSQTVRYRGIIETWDEFSIKVGGAVAGDPDYQGRGLRVLTATVTSPTLASQLSGLLKKYPRAKWHTYEAVGQDNPRDGAKLAFGKAVDTVYQLNKAQVILALDCDFLFALPGSLQYARDFTDGRRMTVDKPTMNRLYVAEAAPSITGAMADHRIPLAPSRIEQLAREILRRVTADVRGDPKPDADAAVTGVPDAWLAAVVKDLKSHQGAGVVMTGPGQPPIVHALVHAINATLNNFGQTLKYIAPVEVRAEHDKNTLSDLVTDIGQGQVETLIILGGNPVYNAPGNLDFAKHLSQVSLKIHHSDFYDETSRLCDWHVPAAHPLESWSDTRAFDGTATIVQPLIAPLYAGKTPHEVLSVLAGESGRSAFEIVETYWKTKLDAKEFGKLWRRAVHSGVVAGSQSEPAEVSLKTRAITDFAASPTVALVGRTIEVEFHPDSTIWDGQFANNGWLQELPKPLTKTCWENVAYVSPATAGSLGLSNGAIIELTIDKQVLRAPAWIMPGQPDHCVSLTFGYGRTHSGRVGTRIGYNAYSILPVNPERFAQATLDRTAEKVTIATTQHHHSMEGRDIVRVTALSQFHAQARQPHQEEHPLPSFYPERQSEGNAWGMVIDQTSCIGCNACVVACQSENNSPVVGKEQVLLGREMQWLRIDRYYHGELDDPEVYFQPMMCVHCEKAPCEVVCPVAATVHDSEGTNSMIYNRCVGTRYCSNNCPYKVRRFNYLQFSDDTSPSLKLMRNPEVTVRSRGVMEKCTYCIQRISSARIHAKIETGAVIEDGDVVTACQQACPTRAITFGNINDPKSEVVHQKSSILNYGVLAELNTVPRTTHLARVVNPHPDLPAPGAAQSFDSHSHAGKVHE
jgi:MoCo/4Fe-4S cofactor protein with predicted Tat translocation signal